MSATRRELLEERWKVLMTDVTIFAGESDISSINSKRWKRINETLEELAAMLVDEVSDAEMGSLETATTMIWESIRGRLFDWAEWLEEQRAERQGQMLAHVAPYVTGPEATA